MFGDHWRQAGQSKPTFQQIVIAIDYQYHIVRLSNAEEMHIGRDSRKIIGAIAGYTDHARG